MTDFAGWRMPLRFTSELAEHGAVRRYAGLFDLSHMGQIEVTGPDAATACGRALVSRLDDLPVGRARYTLMVNDTGGVVDDLIAYRLGEAELLVICNAANRLRVNDRLSAAADGLRASVTDRTSHRALLALQGPAARELLAPFVGARAHRLRPFRVMHADVTLQDGASIPILLARTGYTGEDGVELAVPAASAAVLWRDLLDRGASRGLLPCGLAARDSLRLEAGMALYGNELSEEVTPAAAGLARLVHTDHDFVGRRALLERAGETTTLIGLAGSGRRAARAGDRVIRHGRDIGHITSGTLSPTLGHPIALARVEGPVPPATDLTVDVRGRPQVMTVVEPPFYRRPATGPASP